MSQSPILKKFTATMHLLDEFRKSALQPWTMSGSGRSHFLALYRREDDFQRTEDPHRIMLNGNTVTVQRLALNPSEQNGREFAVEIPEYATQVETNELIFRALRESLGPADSLSLFGASAERS